MECTGVLKRTDNFKDLADGGLSQQKKKLSQVSNFLCSLNSRMGLFYPVSILIRIRNKVDQSTICNSVEKYQCVGFKTAITRTLNVNF